MGNCDKGGQGQGYASFNNIAVISLRLALFVEETGVPGENHRLALTSALTYENYKIDD